MSALCPGQRQSVRIDRLKHHERPNLFSVGDCQTHVGIHTGIRQRNRQIVFIQNGRAFICLREVPLRKLGKGLRHGGQRLAVRRKKRRFFQLLQRYSINAFIASILAFKRLLFKEQGQGIVFGPCDRIADLHAVGISRQKTAQRLHQQAASAPAAVLRRYIE